MKERPILMSTPMVRAVLEGRKTQTRRVVKPQGAILTDELARSLGVRPPEKRNQPVIACPYGKLGDRLWVREAWRKAYAPTSFSQGVVYRADALKACGMDEYSSRHKWKPSIHMPRWASRITLEITGVRVERLQAISETDALEEGITYNDIPNNGLDPLRARTWFRGLWESINGPGSWDANPWVWVLEFKAAGGVK